MTDIMKLADDYARSYMSFGEPAARAALQSAIEALQAECAELQSANDKLNDDCAMHMRVAVAAIDDKVLVMAERDTLQAKLDELQRQDPVKFLVNGARFKLANCGPSSSGFVGFPKELAGRWVALVAADDDCHLKLAAPKALAPEQVEAAWRAGWAACRDAEYVGQEAEDEAWGMSETCANADWESAAPKALEPLTAQAVPWKCINGEACKHGWWCSESYCQKHCVFRSPSTKGTPT